MTTCMPDRPTDANTLSPEERSDTFLAILDTLVDALRFQDQQLIEKAVRALVRIGPRAVPRLISEEAQRQNSNLVHRERLMRVAQGIRQFGQQPGNAAAAVTDFLIDALRPYCKTLNKKAADTLCRLQEAVVERLVREACLNQSRPGYCVRLLEVVERIGKMSDVDSRLDMYILIGNANARIREAAIRAFIGVGPASGSTPKSCAAGIHSSDAKR